MLRTAICFLSLCLISPHLATAKPQKNTCKLRVAVDIGHSRRDPGAISATGKTEYSFNKRFTHELVGSNNNHKNLEFVIINPSGAPIALRKRTKEAAQKKADIFLSFHHDAVNRKYLKTWVYNKKKRIYSDKFRGHSIFVSRQNPQFSNSLKLAKSIGARFLESGLSPTLHHAEPIRGENRELLDRKLGVYNAPFAVLKSASMPSVLLELGVILHREEERLLERSAYRKFLIGNVIKALEDYCHK